MITPRDAWGADLPPQGPLAVEAPGDVRVLLVHHSAGGNDYAAADVPGLLRDIYAFHTGDRGWPDVAYNFFVDRHGGVWEGRAGSISAPVRGDATGGSQGYALLSCVLGTFTDEAPPAAAIDALTALLAQLADTYGVDTTPGASTSFESRGSNRWPAGAVVTARTISGHRDMSRTACPGDALYALVDDGSLAAAVTARRAGSGPAPEPDPTTTTDTTAAPSTTAPTTTAPATTTTSPTTSAVAAAPAEVADAGDDRGMPLLVPSVGAAVLAAAVGAVAALRLRRR